MVALHGKLEAHDLHLLGILLKHLYLDRLSHRALKVGRFRFTSARMCTYSVR